MRVLVAGSSGLIGTALVAHLRETGHEVLRLVRRVPAAPDERGWDPPAGRIDEGTFDGVDAVVNLNGVGIGDRPWSGARKQLIRDSRNVPTEVLALAVAEHGVPALLNASGINYYGDTGSRLVDETAPNGAGFLAEVCRDWEAATAPAAAGRGPGGAAALGRGAVPGRRRARPAAAAVPVRAGRPARLRCAVLPVDLAGGRGRRDPVPGRARRDQRPGQPGRARSWSPTPSSPGRWPRRSAGRRRSWCPSSRSSAVLGQMAEEMVLTGPRAEPAVLLARRLPVPARHGARGAGRSGRLVSAHDVVVVGAGLAGLRAAGLLRARGLDVVLLDAADRPGGRVATDEIDGFRCDRGFQVLNTSYPALRAAADLDALALRAFEPGAAIRGADRRLHVFANPARSPGLLWRTATDGLLPPLGKAKLAAWTARVLAAPPARTARRIDRSAAQDLAAAGLTGPVVDRFLRPFLSGVLGEAELSTSAAFVRLVWRSFALGTIAVPDAGMGALPAQLAARLPAGVLRLGRRVTGLRGPHRVAPTTGR